VKFVIEGQEYERASIGRLSLWDIKELKKQTGLTVADVEDAAAYLETFPDEVALMSDDRAIDLLGAIVWLARWTSGDRVSFEESMQVPVEDISVVTDDDSEESEEDQDPTESAPEDTAAAGVDDAQVVLAAV
jgi:hypothetical protein